MTKQELHSLQLLILKHLLFHPRSRFADMIPETSSDQKTFHIKTLVEQGLVAKDETSGLYSLTLVGKDFANRHDTDSEKMTYEKQAKIGVCIAPIRIVNGQVEFLIEKRLKEPYFGFYGFMTGKIKLGESVFETAARELLEETNLTGTLSLKGIQHIRNKNEEGVFLEDKYFFLFTAHDLQGELREKFEGGEFSWMTLQKLKSQEYVYENLLHILETLNSKNFEFIEYEQIVKGY